MAYDLCYEAWEPAFRRQVAERLARMAGVFAARPVTEEPFDPTTPLDEVGALTLADPLREGGDYQGMGFTRRVLVSQLLLLGLQGDPEVEGLPFPGCIRALARTRTGRPAVDLEPHHPAGAHPALTRETMGSVSAFLSGHIGPVALA